MATATKDAPKKRIGEQLIEAGLIDTAQLKEALTKQKESGRKVVEVLIDLGHLGVDEVAKFLSNQPGTPSIELKHYTIPAEVCALVPREFALEHEAIPIDKMGRLLTVGMAFPLDRRTIDKLQELTGLKVKTLLCKREDIRAAVERYYPKDEKPAEPTEESLAADLKLSGVVGVIRRIDSLPTLPETVQKVKGLIDSPDSSATEIAAVISGDPPIAARLLQLANSAAYGFASKVDSVDRAAALLGLRETFNVVMSSAVIDVTKNGGAMDYEKFWDESMATAQACRLLAKALGKRADGGLSTAGLLCAIGRFALAESVPNRYKNIDATLRGSVLAVAEEDELGIAHPEAGYELATHWALPEEIATAIRFHLAPDRADTHQDMVATVGLAALLSALQAEGADSAQDALAREEMMLSMAGISAKDAVNVYQEMISGE